jgi:hypothetical protein
MGTTTGKVGSYDLRSRRLRHGFSRTKEERRDLTVVR